MSTLSAADRDVVRRVVAAVRGGAVSPAAVPDPAPRVAASPRTADRQTVKAIVTERPKLAYRRCPYCSTPCYGAACRAHRDLLDLERAVLAEVDAYLAEAATA